MGKVLVVLYVPILEKKYEIWLPLQRKIGPIINLLVKALGELTAGEYTPKKMPLLYDKQTANVYEIDKTVKDAGIKNGTEVILI